MTLEVVLEHESNGVPCRTTQYMQYRRVEVRFVDHDGVENTISVEADLPEREIRVLHSTPEAETECLMSTGTKGEE